MRSFLNKVFNMLGWSKDKKIADAQKTEQEAYLHYILDFVDPKTYANRIGLDIDSLHEFDLVDEQHGNELVGHLNKRFVRLHRAYMKDYFDVVKKSQNCSFVSYLENEDIKNDFIPKNLSVLVKKMISIPSDKESAYLKIVKKRTFAEVVCPKILNFYGCETVFNECLVTDNIYVLSLDFIKPNQTYYALMDLKGNFQFLANGRVDNNVDAFKKQIEQLKHLIANNENLFFKKQPTADVDEMTEKLVYSWLIRCILLGDTDFSSKNFGLIYDNVKNEITSAPNYDFEFCVKVLRPDFVAKNGMIDPHGYFANIKYVMENYPSVYKKFIEKTKMISSLNPKTGNRFYEDFVYEKIQDEIISEKFCEVLKSNISYIFKNDKKLEKLDSQLQM